MADIIRMDMTVEDRRAFQALKRLAGGFKAMTAEEKKAVKAAKELERAHKKLGGEGKRIYEQSMTAAQRYRRQVEALRQAKKMGILTEKQHAQAISHTRREMRMAGDAGRRAFGPQALSMVKGLAVSLGAGAGVAGAVAKVTQGYQTWLTIAREISAETRRAADDMIAFAALQAGGTKAARVQRAQKLAIRFGVTDRGQAFSTVQALQSASREATESGRFEAGLQAAETVFAASQLGVSVETGREAEVFGAGRGLAPGASIRKAFVAGQESAREPETLAKIGPALPFWADPDLAFAAGATLVKSVKEGQLEVFVRRAGMGLSTTGSLQKTFEDAGLGQASQLDRLRFLKAQGLETPEQLEAAGVTEVRERIGISGLVRNLPELERVHKSIREKAIPGLLAGKRAEVEAELPTAVLARQAGQLEALFRGEQALGPVAEEMTGVEIRERARGVAAQRMGFRQSAMGGRVADTEGRVSGGAMVRAWIEGAIRSMAIRTHPVLGLPGVRGRIERRIEAAGLPGTGLEELQRLPALTEEVLQELKTMNQQNQNPTLGKPGVNEMLGTDPHDK